MSDEKYEKKIVLFPGVEAASVGPVMGPSRKAEPQPEASGWRDGYRLRLWRMENGRVRIYAQGPWGADTRIYIQDDGTAWIKYEGSKFPKQTPYAAKCSKAALLAHNLGAASFDEVVASLGETK